MTLSSAWVRRAVTSAIDGAHTAAISSAFRSRGTSLSTITSGLATHAMPAPTTAPTIRAIPAVTTGIRIPTHPGPLPPPLSVSSAIAHLARGQASTAARNVQTAPSSTADTASPSAISPPTTTRAVIPP